MRIRASLTLMRRTGRLVYIDGDGRVVESTGYRYGPAGTSLCKKVVFALTSGIYTIQLANALTQTVKIEVAAGTP